jgi:hypothetical protein
MRTIVVLALLLVGSVALAGAEWHVETAVLADRATAERVAAAAGASGMQVRIVRRYQFGRGWEHVVLAEHLASAQLAQEAAQKLAGASGGTVQVYRNADGRVTPEGVSAPTAAAPAAPTVAPARGVGDIVRRIEDAHGGDTGGAAGLARAAAIHFVYARTVPVDGRMRTIDHDYWRAQGGRRLEVRTAGAGVDSLAVASEKGGWIRANGTVVNRDAGVLVTTIDGFAPEAVLTLALDVPTLLRSPEVERFKPLEGAESGVRIGHGGDETAPGLSFIDADPGTGRLLRARYVTEAGPITVSMTGWKEAAPGIVFPAALQVERADGSREEVSVRTLEVLPAAPGGTFAKP